MTTQPLFLSILPAGLLPLARCLHQTWRQLSRLAVVRKSGTAAARSTRPHDVLLDVEAEAPGACGWFDSSHELVHGLQVQELNTPESLAAALPLASWLQLQLEGRCSAQPA